MRLCGGLSSRLRKVLLLIGISCVSLPAGTAVGIECYECHGTKSPVDLRPLDAPIRDISSGGFQGNHRSHMGSTVGPASCNPCHAGSSGVPSSYSPDHRDGTIQISDNINNSPHPDKGAYAKGAAKAVFFNQTSLPQLGSCSNVNCHFESQTPLWGSPPFTSPDDCDKCHADNPTSGGHPGAGGRHAGIACESCHSTHATFGHATSGRLQLQFSPVPGGSYSGDLTRFLPSQSAGKAYGSCRNIYCHSDATAVASGVIGYSGATFANHTTPTWGESSALTCTSCHNAPPNYGQAYWVKYGQEFFKPGPKANYHYIGDHRAEGCTSCHFATTDDGATIKDPRRHGNGVYDVVPGPGISFRYDYDPGGGRCSTIVCHNRNHPTGDESWGEAPTYLNVTYAKTDCHTYTFSVNDAELLARGEIAPLSITWDFGDGSSTNGSFSVTHRFADRGTYIVKVTVRDKTRHLIYNNLYIPVDETNIRPSANIAVAVDGQTVTLTDLSIDPDYNECGHSGTGTISISWNDSSATLIQPLALTDSPSGTIFRHTYQTAGTYSISVQILDNSGDTPYSQLNPLTAQVPPGDPASTTFKGHVTDHETGLGLEGATVQLKNPLAVPSVVSTVTTDAAGSYAFTPVQLGVNYLIEVSKDGRLFNPASKTAWISPINGGQTAVIDFHTSSADTEPKISIGGRITDQSGAGKPAYLTLLKGDVTVGVSSTNNDGIYSFGEVDDDCYTVKPSYEAGYGYTPETREVCFTDPHVDFTYHPVNVIQQLAGSLHDDVGTDIPNVTVTLKDASGKVVSTQTVTGSFSFYNRVAEGCYSIETQKFGYVFAPAVQSVCGTGGESITTLNVIGQPAVPPIVIGGTVTDALNGGPATAMVRLLKGETVYYKSPQWTAPGVYQFDPVPPDCYTVEPVDERYQYTPASREVCDGSSAIHFSSTARETMDVGGEIYNGNGIPLRFPITVTIKDASGRLLSSSQTSATTETYIGKYSGLVRKSCVTVEPVAGTFTFAPAARTVCEAIRNLDFKATDTRFRVKGRVTDQAGVGQAGVTLSLQDVNGTVLRTQQTMSDGYYSFGKLDNACYRVVPAPGAVPFSPLSSQVCGENTNLNFTAVNSGSGTAATPLDSTRISVTWLDFSDETGFSVERCSGEACTDFTEIYAAGPDVTHYIDATVCSGTSYVYRVRAFKSGEWEQVSNTVGASTPLPVAPADLTAAVQSESRVLLAWNHTGTEQTGFSIERCAGPDCSGFTQVATVGAAARTYLDNGVAPGSYSYRVRAYKDGACPWQSEYTPPATVETATPLLGDFAVSAGDTTTANFFWTDNSTRVSRYTLDRCTGVGCENFTPIASLDKDPAAVLSLNLDEPGWTGAAGEVTDSSGNDSHGTAYGGATTVAGGKPGRAGSFDGIDGYVAAPVDGRTFYQWTIEMWIRPEPLNAQKMIFQWGDSATVDTSNPFIRLIRNSNGTVQWGYSYYIGGTNPYTSSSTTGQIAAPDSQWTHLVLTYDGTRLRTYGNGAFASRQMINLTQSDKALVAIVGAGKGYAVGEHNRYKGLVDGVVLYRRALSATEVLARYQSSADQSVCSATTYRYRVKAVNTGLSNAGGGCWSTRAPLAITDFQPNFQTRVVVPHAPGMKDTFDDVRFYDVRAGREIPAWLDTKTDGVTATFWVRTGATNDVYLYYGNPGALSSSNGRATFEVFDDFRDTISLAYSERPKWLDTIWSYNNDNGYLYITSGNGTANFSYGSGYDYTWTAATRRTEILEACSSLGTDYHAQIRLNNYTANNQTFAGLALSNTAMAYTFGRFRNDATSEDAFRVEKLDGSNAASFAATTTPAYLAVKKVGGSFSFFLSHDNANWNLVGGPYSDITPTRLSLFGKETANGTSALSFSMDDFYVRKYAATEPSVAIGAEEALGACLTLGWENPYSVAVTVTTPTPAAPDALTLKPYDTQIDLTWTRHTTDESGFVIERCQGVGCGTFAQVATVAAGATTYSDVGLVLGETYSYRVKAYKTASCSWETPYSEPATGTTAVLAPVLSVAPYNTTQLNLSWLDNARSETAYTVERCQGEACSDFTPIATVAGSAYADASVCSGAGYSYRVNAVSRGFSNSGGGCWQWRVPLTISSFQPNYQTRISISYNAAVRADFADIRFYDAVSGQELPYWLEGKTNSYSAVVWVRTGANAAVYMYFGNPSATSASNGPAVFEVYDDFDDGVIDPARWTLLPGNGSLSESGGALNFSYAGAGANDWSTAKGREMTALRLNTLPATDFLAAIKMNSYTVATSTHAGIAVYGSDASAYLWGRYSGPPEDYGLTRLDGTLIGSYSSSTLPEVFAIKKTGPNYSFFYGSDNYYLQQKGATYNDVPFNGIVLFGKEWGSNSLSFGLDYFYVRRLAAKEPTVYYDYAAKVQSTVCGATWNGPYSSSVAGTTPAPTPPASLAAIAVSPSRINLSWSQTSDETGFRVERCSTDGCSDFTEIATVGTDVTAYSDEAVTSGTSYSYRIRGYKTTAGCSWVSDYSAPATAVADTVPPAGLSATPVSATQVNLAWTDTTAAETGFRIERCAGAGCTDFTPIATVGANVTSYPDTAVASGQSYSYRVKAWSGGMFGSGGCWSKKSSVYLSSNFQPNYQNKVTIYYSPTLTPGLKPDFSDIRFYDETSRQEIPYWVEKIAYGTDGSASATVWYKSGATNTISMYFGNQNATSVSNGTATFELFDDFSDGSLGSLWTLLAGNGSIQEAGGALNFNYPGAQGNDWNAGGRQGAALLLNSLPAGDFFAEVRLNDYTVTDQSSAGMAVYGSDTSAYLLGRTQSATYNNFSLQKSDGTAVATGSISTAPYYLGLKKTGTQYSFWGSYNNSYWSAIGGTYSDVPLNGLALFGKESGTSDLSFSLGPFYVRKLAATEPSPSVDARSFATQQVSVCSDVWEGPYSGESTAVTP